MQKFIQRIYIQKQDKLYNVKNDLIEFGLLWDNKNSCYYNKYELNEESFEKIIWLCKKHDFTYEIKQEKYKNEVSKIEASYKLQHLNESTFVIKNRKDEKFLYLISIYEDGINNRINVVNNANGEFFTYKTTLTNNKNRLVSLFIFLENKEIELKESLKNFDYGEFFLIMSILMSEFSAKEEIYGKINKFKFYNISKLPEHSFLCNCVKGFFPETRFFLEKGKIRSSLSQNYLNKEQSTKIWKYLFYNRDRVAAEHKPSLRELFVDGRINVRINSFDTKMPISNVLWNNGNIIVTLFNGVNKVTLNKTFTKDELWNEIIKNR